MPGLGMPLNKTSTVHTPYPSGYQNSYGYPVGNMYGSPVGNMYGSSTYGNSYVNANYVKTMQNSGNPTQT